MQDQITVPVPPHLFDGMYNMTLPMEVDLNKKMVHVDFMPEYGNCIMEDIVKGARKKYPDFDVVISK